MIINCWLTKWMLYQLSWVYFTIKIFASLFNLVDFILAVVYGSNPILWRKKSILLINVIHSVYESFSRIYWTISFWPSIFNYKVLNNWFFWFVTKMVSVFNRFFRLALNTKSFFRFSEWRHLDCYFIKQKIDFDF